MSEPDLRVSSLKADCSQCMGLCCVGLAFSASADFPFDKDSGEPCRHLQPDDRCGIHERLRPEGFKGCTVFDCLGAGQQTSRVVLGGIGWREDPDRRVEIFAVFQVMRRLHELLWYLTEARDRALDPASAGAAAALLAEVEVITHGDADAVLGSDVGAYRDRVNLVLATVSAGVRDGAPARRPHRRIRSGADLAGADLRGADLRGADLRGALLIAADLRGADLRAADLIGADVRDADVGGADLTDVLFMTQQQLNATNGNAATRPPSRLDRPAHWRS